MNYDPQKIIIIIIVINAQLSGVLSLVCIAYDHGTSVKLLLHDMHGYIILWCVK